MKPPGEIKSKLRNHVSKEIFLGYNPHTTRNVIYYDVDTHKIKLDYRVIFDEGMNNFTMADTPLNAQRLRIVDIGNPPPEEQKSFPDSQFELSISPFTDLLPVLLKSNTYSPNATFGFTYQYNYILKRSFVNTLKSKYLYSKIFSNPRSTNNNLRGGFVTSIHVTCVFTSTDALKQILLLHYQGVF